MVSGPQDPHLLWVSEGEEAEESGESECCESGESESGDSEGESGDSESGEGEGESAYARWQRFA